MKTKNLIERLSLFLLALVLTMPTWAQGGSGNESETITIASKADWKTFCDRVNSGQTTLNAKLTKDVDLGEEIVMAGTLNPYSSGYDFFYYTGTFDGQGHTLKFNWNAGEKNYIAPFWCVKDATIKNLRTQGKITTKGYGLSGMVRIALGTTTISGCISDVDITGGNSGWNDSKAAGMVQAVASGASVQITDCLVKGRITDTADEDYRMMAGFVFDNSGTYTLTRCLYVGTNNAANSKNSYTFGTEKGISATFTDCYYLNTCGKAQGKQVTAERLKSGEMAYLLQNKRPENVWGQTLGTDTIPQPTTDATKRVYEVKFVYNGEVKATRYATNGQSIHGGLPTAQDLLGTGYNPHHYYAIAFADGFNASTTVTADRQVTVSITEKDCYEIASKADWQAFCALVEDGQTAVDAKMTKDVDLETDITMAGTANKPYAGTFDGQGHTLKIDWNAGSTNDVAPFGRVNGATIKNLRVSGQMTTDAPMGVFSYLAGGTTIYEHCVSDVRITSGNTNSSYSAAGMVRAAYSEGKITFKDCIVAGDLNGTTDNSSQNMGGFVCSQADDATCTFDNCLYTGTNNSKGGYTFAPNPTLNNCYYLNPFANTQGERIVEKQLKSGEVAYKLQGDRTDSCHWAQVLGEKTPSLYREADRTKPNYVYYNKDNNGWTCDDFRLTDGQSLPIGLDFTATKATYDRTLAAGKATLCLPYELPVQGFRAYTLADRQESRTAVHFKEVNGTLGAYRPYLLVADAPARLDGENLQVKADRSSIVLSAGNYYFKGAVHDVVNWWLTSDHAYILQADGLFHKVTSNPSVTVPAYRAYISYNSHEGAKPLSIVFDGETTGIYGTTDGATDGAADGAVYNLQGQRVADRLDDSVRRQIPTGVYIVNGRKVIVK